jgi:hypothetical protein
VITALENQYAYTRAGTTLCNYRPTPTLLKRRQESSAHSLRVASSSPTVSVIKVANVLGVKPSDIILRMETLLKKFRSDVKVGRGALRWADPLTY